MHDCRSLAHRVASQLQAGAGGSIEVMTDGLPRARTRSHLSTSATPVHRSDGTAREGTVMEQLSLSHINAAHPLQADAKDGDLSVTGYAVGHDRNERGESSALPPSFAAIEFETIVRRLRNRARFKPRGSTPRYPHLGHDWEFAGWGSLRYVDVTAIDLEAARANNAELAKAPHVGQLRATSVAGNAVFGSVFYSIPAIAAVSGVLSPLCMVVSCLTFLLFKPVMSELGDAIRLNGANYMYLLNFTGKRLALFGAAVTLLDAVATGVTSAATAASYIDGEITLPFPVWIISMLIIVLFSALLLLGIRESTGVTLTICLLHCMTMAGLVIAACVHWGRIGSDLLTENWQTVPNTGPQIAKAVFNGICVGVLGVTGFESVPTYIESVRPAAFDATLRNLVWGAFAFNLPTLLVSFACLGVEEIQGGANVLALLAERVAGKWLRYIVVVDAVVSVSSWTNSKADDRAMRWSSCKFKKVNLWSLISQTGGVAVSGLFEKLSLDRAIPIVFHRPIFSSAAYLGICFAVYAATAFNTATVSAIFSMSFMATMFMYTVSALLLKMNRNGLKRRNRCSLVAVLSAMACAATVILNIVIQDQRILYTFGAAFLIIFAILLGYQEVAGAAKWALYCLDNITWFRRQASFWAASLIRIVTRLKQREVCVWVKEDEISSMMEAVLYVRHNEQTARLLLIHAYNDVDGIPTELEANTKILDEAFPSITIDLVLVHGKFNPDLLLAVSRKLKVPTNLHLVSGMRSSSLADYSGARIIHM